MGYEGQLRYLSLILDEIWNFLSEIKSKLKLDHLRFARQYPIPLNSQNITKIRSKPLDRMTVKGVPGNMVDSGQNTSKIR